MIRRALLAAGVLLLLWAVVAAKRKKSGDPPNLGIGYPPAPRYDPFCYCRRGYIWRPLRGWPYCKCYKIVRDLASWAEAKVYCQTMRSNMVEVKDRPTQLWLQNQLYRRRGNDHHHLLEKAEYWLGATDLEQERTWVWDPSYTNIGDSYWLPAEPNNYLSYQNCLAIKQRSRRSYGWFDDDCYQRKFYICERRGWYCWGWSCYRKYASGNKVSIPNAEAAAKMEHVSPATKEANEKVPFEN